MAALAICAAAAPTAAHATWSLVAVDPSSGDVGGAIASCVELPAGFYDAEGVLELLVLVPGVGAGVTQANVNLEAAKRIRAGLEAGEDAAAVIDDVTADSFDTSAAERQHAVVRLDETTPGAFTGSETIDWAGHRTGEGVSVQGNVLVSDAVVGDALGAFEEAEGPLGNRLLEGLLAGSEAGGDSRCDPGQAALFAQVAVVSRDGELEVTTARVEQGDGRNPVELLAAGERSDPPAALSWPSWWVLLAGLAVGLSVLVGLAARRRRRAAPA